MNRKAYLEQILTKYSGTFDIHRSYRIHGKEYPAYGYFFSCIEKYVLVREANLWISNSFEHILFMEEEKCSEDILTEANELIKNYMEPVLVCKGKKEPEKNHMYSYLTIAIISDKIPDRKVQKMIKHMNFEKGYRFNIRGYSQGRIILVSTEGKKVFTNRMGKKAAKMYQELLK